MPKIRVVVADDHALVRSGLRALLSAQPDMEVVGEAADGVAVVAECRRLAPDVVLLDLSMPGRGGVAAIEDLRQTCPAVKSLVVTMHEDEAYVRQAVRAGASGYLLKKSFSTELIHAVRAVHGGRQYIAAALTLALAGHDECTAHPGGPQGRPVSLSPRESEVVGLIALGHTTQEIARRLYIGGKTVETHRMHINDKLGLRTRADLVRFAIEHGLLVA